MIEKEIYVIRHGQTELNAKGIVQGKGIDHPLNELGIQQANAFYQAYKDFPFEIMYSSSLKRAQQTIEQFHQHAIPHIIDADLDEISWGDAEGKGGFLDTSDEFFKLMKEWDSGNMAYKFEGGESPLELQSRQIRFLEKLKVSSEKKILIATHGRFIRAFMCTVLKLPLQQMNAFEHTNLCLYKLNLLKDGRFEIELQNEQGHLSGL